jgi:glycopeptide antibiotics resistance protein
MKKYILAIVPIILELMRIFIEQIRFYSVQGNFEFFYNRYYITTVIVNITIQMIIILILLKFTRIKSIKDILTNLIFILYICALYKMTIYNNIIAEIINSSILNKVKINNEIINLIPFKNIILAFNGRASFVQVFGNLILLSPLAFYIRHYRWVLDTRKVILSIFLVVCIIEFYQLSQSSLLSMYSNQITSLKIFDIDDIILNTLGGFIGILVYNLYFKFKNTYKATLIYKYTYGLFILTTLLFSMYYFNNLYYAI